MARKLRPTTLSEVGVAGVHFVVAELSRRGWVAMPTIRNTKGIDVLASKEGLVVEIQVKSSAKWRSWILSESAQTLDRKNLFYVFVNLNENEAPEYFIMPSAVVAEYLNRTNKQRLEAGCRELGMIEFLNAYTPELKRNIEKYKDKWALLASQEG
jgi:hypothetical protein